MRAAWRGASKDQFPALGGLDWIARAIDREVRDGSQSRKLLDLIFDHIQQPQFQVRRQWKPGTLAFWDNRVTQHYTVADYAAAERVMYRVTILGDKPFHRPG